MVGVVGREMDEVGGRISMLLGSGERANRVACDGGASNSSVLRLWVIGTRNPSTGTWSWRMTRAWLGGKVP